MSNFLTLANKIYLKKKYPETALAYTKFPEIWKFPEIIIVDQETRRYGKKPVAFSAIATKFFWGVTRRIKNLSH